MRKAIWTAAKALSVALVLGLVYLVLRRIGFGNIVQAMKKTSPGAIGIALVLFFAVFVLWALRWQQLMKREERKNLAALFPIYMAGVFGNVVTPGARVGGEPIRAYYMSKAFGGEMSAHLGTILVDKLSNGVVVTGFLLLSAILVLLYMPLGVVAKAVLAGAVLFIAGAVVGGFLLRKQVRLRSRIAGKLLPALYNSGVLRFIRRRFASYQHFEDYAIGKLDNLITPLGRTARSPRAIAKVVAISVVSWMFIYLAHYVLFRNLGADIGFLRVLVVVTVSTLCGDVSVSPGGAGFMEAAMIGLCTAFGVDNSTSAAVTLISRGIFYAYGLCLGGACLVGLGCLYGRRR